MKYILLGLGLAIAAPSFAQQYDNAFNYTVFANYKNLKIANPTANNVMRERAQAQFPGWYVITDKLGSGVSDMFGKAVAVQGATAADKAAYCLQNKLNNLDVVPSEWTQTSANDASFGSFVHYQQAISGHPVMFASLGFRFTTDGKLLRVEMNSYGKPGIYTRAAIDRTQIEHTQALTEDISSVVVADKTIDADWVWFPVPATTGYELHPAWGFTVNGKAANGAPLELKGYIDANTGDLLYRTNNIESLLNFKVTGSVYKTNTLQPASVQPLANLAITVGSNTYNTNDTGFIATSLTTPANVTFALKGKWSTIHNVTTTGTIPTFTVNNLINGNFLFPDTTPSNIRDVNVYYHLNIVHDYIKSKYPTFTGIDASINAAVDESGTCNAFYGGGSLNFYAAGGGCNSFSEISDVMYHEYGHYFSDKFYTATAGKTLTNGALNEASSDVWAMSITHIPIIGRNCYVGDTNSTIRRYDQAPKVYPTDIVGEVHADGMIVAGAWWDVGVNTGSVDTMTSLFVKTYYDVPDGPNGTEGDVYHKVLIGALLSDDDDANFATGTPHMQQIVAAFARHGIYLLSDAVLDHKELASFLPSNAPLTINTTLTLVEPAFFQSLKMFFRNRDVGTWDSVVMTNAGPGPSGGTNYTASIPAQPAGSIAEYYFGIYNSLSAADFYYPLGYSPLLASNQVTIPYQVAIGVVPYSKTDFESQLSGWTVGNVAGDNAGKAGRWIQAIPIASSYQGLIVQTGSDHTTGAGQCLVTGNATSPSANYNTADVDSGKTTVVTPVFDVTGLNNPIVEYFRWYSDDRGSNGRSDAWLVQIRDSTSFIWKNVDNTYQADYNWRRRVFAIKDFLPGSQYIQLRFVATDALNSSLQNYGQSCVEALVDDVSIMDLGTLSVKNLAAAKMNIYPNPANNQLNVSIPTGLTGILNLIDITGRQLESKVVNENTTGYSFNTAQLAAGQYLLSIQTNGLTETKKVVIGH